MLDISAIIITKNEEEKIGDCLESIKWIDEVIVVDENSEDRTLEICKKYANVRTYQYNNMKHGDGFQKNYALSLATKEWVFCLDADERVSPELKKEILDRVGKEEFDGYYFRMKYLAFGKWVLDYKPLNLRLFKRKKGKFSEKIVHTKVILNGKIGIMNNPIIHISRTYRSVKDYLAIHNRYAFYEAEDLYNAGERIAFTDIPLIFIGKPILGFLRKFVLWGYKYRFCGFLLSVLTGYNYFLIYVKLWKRQRKK